jgi:hypothetical protein
MIVQASVGGVLEFFWRHPAATALLRIKPSDLLSLRKRHSDLRGLRDWLSLQPGCTSVQSIDDQRIISRVGEAIRAREIAVAQLPATPRLPGTGVAVSSQHGPVLLLPYRKLYRALDLSKALAWLQERDPSQLTWLRLILSDDDEWPLRDIYQPEQIRAEIETLLKSGKLIPVFTLYPTSKLDPLPELPAVEPPDLKREIKVVEEANTFDADHEAAAQANAMIAAAESGVPFCEVCNRK